MEGPNHFADMDQPSPARANATLLQLSEDPAFVDPAKWSAFYDSVQVRVSDRGLLPFRVWQLFDAMVDAVNAGVRAR